MLSLGFKIWARTGNGEPKLGQLQKREGRRGRCSPPAWRKKTSPGELNSGEKDKSRGKGRGGGVELSWGEKDKSRGKGRGGGVELSWGEKDKSRERGRGGGVELSWGEKDKSRERGRGGGVELNSGEGDSYRGAAAQEIKSHSWDRKKSR